MRYYLANGIYHDWSTLLKTIRNLEEEKCRRFVKEQDACRKDVERAFGVIQSRYAIIRHSTETWSHETM
jgi:hypothetical protein